MRRKQIIHNQYTFLSQYEIMLFLISTDFTKIDNSKEIETEFFNEFRNFYNGEPVFAKFQCKDVFKFNQSINWFGIDMTSSSINFNNYKEYKVNEIALYIFKNNSLSKIYGVEGDLIINGFNNYYEKKENFLNINFEEISPYIFDGVLTELLFEGSVYNKWGKTKLETKQKALEFTSLIFQERYEDFRIYKTHENWFENSVGEDVIFLIFDKGKGQFWILTKRDYD